MTIHPTIMKKVWVCVRHEKAVEKVIQRLRDDKDGEDKNYPSSLHEDITTDAISRDIILLSERSASEHYAGDEGMRDSFQLPDIDDDDFLSFLDDMLVKKNEGDVNNELDTDRLTLDSSLENILKSNETKEEDMSWSWIRTERLGW